VSRNGLPHWLLLASILASAASPASAQAPSNAERAAARRRSPRVRPDQARGWQREPGPSAGDVALFMPRALLFLPELALRTAFIPIRAVLDFAGRNTTAAGIESEPEPERQTLSVYPYFSYLSGFGPSVGAYGAYDNLSGNGEHLKLAARMFGRDYPAVTLAMGGDSIGGSGLWIETSASYQRRPREVFAGIGNGAGSARTPNADPRASTTRTRYRIEELTLKSQIGRSFGTPRRRTKLGLSSRYTSARFASDRASANPDPALDEVYDTRALIGYADGLQVLEELLHVIVDTRDAIATPASGVYADAFAGVAPLGTSRRLARYGADATLHLNLFRRSRVVLARARLEGVEPFAGEAPFSELPNIGGPTRLRGYAPGQFRAEHALLASLEYRYPVHQYVDARLFADTGSVAARLTGLFELDRFRAAAGGGVRIRSSEHVIATLDVAYGDRLWLFFTTTPTGSDTPDSRP